ncbi:acetoacetate-CoA ligase [Radiomyces spectabilis]|uniref:acetoacetate-CoA ligase n=1 Tax=Radiomyces spectabilis TaxID=64574 RepID=UPI00222093C3|nr:acetoacetate-CoA ligase [Radiomyces spectabilis]KAI8384650.1 acetoacetate-CoA ligase [Radiomyces spectabilis]
MTTGSDTLYGSESNLVVDAKCLWTPARPEDTEMERFRHHVNEKYGLQLDNYQDLWRWSVTAQEEFWSTVWDYTKIISSYKSTEVLDKSARMDSIPEWFKGSRLNMAENMLWCRDANKTAIIATGEGHPRRSISYATLYEQVLKCAEAMKASGIQVGDRVAAYIPNCAEAIIAMLAATSLGAIWSSTSPDFGTTGVLDRFAQIKPKILFSVNGVYYNGKKLDHTGKLKMVVEGLPSVEKVVVIPFVPDISSADVPKSCTWDDYLNTVPSDQLPSDIVFEQLPFNHPAFILFSSGTTGLPKCIVHSGAGLLLQLKKEHILHGNMTPDDVFFYYTTTGWMMWNWLVSALSVGCTIVLWDGSPFKPAPISLWELVDELKVTHFGTSAKYIQSLQEANVHPKDQCKLDSLKAVYSTGSPLKPESYEFVYEHIKKDIMLGSITGGTDICSLFAGHNAALPVYRGEIQCICLGMKIEAWAEADKPVFAEAADLVCTAPFPCMPVYMYGDDENRNKYKNAYFSVYDNVWYHGDFVWINPKTGGVIMLGRSDGTLNPSGVRFGSAEIYNVVDRFVSDGVEDTLCVGQKIKDQDDERVVLFIKMREGKTLSEDLVKAIKTTIRSELSPRHVPAFVLPIADIPYTINGKKVEVAVKKIISGQTVTPSATLVNPQCLDLYYNIPVLAQ